MRAFPWSLPVAARATSADRRRTSGWRPGFTLVELVVGLGLLTVGLVGAAGTATILSYYAAAESRAERATGTAASRLATLAAGECASASGTDVKDDLIISWRVRASSRSARAEVTVSYDERGRRRNVELVTGFLC